MNTSTIDYDKKSVNRVSAMFFKLEETGVSRDEIIERISRGNDFDPLNDAFDPFFEQKPIAGFEQIRATNRATLHELKVLRLQADGEYLRSCASIKGTLLPSPAMPYLLTYKGMMETQEKRVALEKGIREAKIRMKKALQDLREATRPLRKEIWQRGGFSQG